MGAEQKQTRKPTKKKKPTPWALPVSLASLVARRAPSARPLFRCSAAHAQEGPGRGGAGFGGRARGAGARMAAGLRHVAVARGGAQSLVFRSQRPQHVLRRAQGPADRRVPHLVRAAAGAARGAAAGRLGLTPARCVAGRSARSR